MGGQAASFEVRTDRPDRVVRAAVERWRRAGAPRAGLLFVAGRLVEHLHAIASHLAEALDSEPATDPAPLWLVAAGVGVLTERAELERQSAGVGLVLEGVSAYGVTSGPRLETFAERLGGALGAHPAASALALVRSDQFEEDMLDGLSAGAHRDLGRRVFGGGAAANQDVFLVGPKGVARGGGAALLLEGLGPARIAAAPACRLLGPLEPVTKMRGSMLLEIAGERALDVLGSSAENLQDQPLILLAVSGAEPVDLAAPRVLLRAIQGVDPSRGGVLINESIRAGARVAFAVRDAATARAGLEERLRQLSRDVAGSAPRFGIYINCAGRGAGLYGAPDVDAKLLRARFGALPFVGLQTAFELAPFEDALALQLYTGVLGLFCAPS